MKIQALENGPILITDENTKPIALCRCGLSLKKPYCDGSHVGRFANREHLILEMTEDDCKCCECGECCKD